MGATHSKVRCLFLPAQSGKTRKVEDKIRELKQLCSIEDEHTIDIFISANNRLLVHQTSARIRRDLGTTETIPEEEDPQDMDVSSTITDDSDLESDATIIKGKIFSWTCGKKNKEFTTDRLAHEMLPIHEDERIEMVLMCANKRRLTYLDHLLHTLTAKRAFRREPAKIYIWIDEADSSMNIWRQFEHLLAIPAVAQVTLISATFGSVLKRYERLSIIPYEETHPACYRRLMDCRCITVMPTIRMTPEEYVCHVLTTYGAAENLLEPGKRAFIPGAQDKISHYTIATLLQETLGFAVIIINGECKELRIPGGEIIDLRASLSCPDPEQLPPEFNQTLATLYYTHRLNRYPMAITGYLCIQRGVTFQCAPVEGQHDGFVFDYGIIPPTRNPAEAYQTTARMFGNTGDFPNYQQPIIFTDEKTFAGISNQEETAVNLPRIVYEEALEDVGEDEFARAAGTTPISRSDPRKTIPIIVPVEPTVIASLPPRGERVAHILHAVAQTHPMLATQLEFYRLIQITTPRPPTAATAEIPGSYKRHILDVVRAAESGTPFAIDIRPEHKSQNCYNVYIDALGARLCIVIWKGGVAATGGGSAAAATAT